MGASRIQDTKNFFLAGEYMVIPQKIKMEIQGSLDLERYLLP
jgi:hypothetical protein